MYGVNNKEQAHLSVVFCKHSLNTERNRMDTIKDEDLNVYKPASPASEAPTTSLLNDLKYSPSGEYQGSEFSRLSCGSELFRVGITPSQGSMWNSQLGYCF